MDEEGNMNNTHAAALAATTTTKFETRHQEKIPARSKRHRVKGFTIWMTGLPGSGKSTLAGVLKTGFEEDYDRNVEILDGDEVRKGLSRDLGLSKADREEHARRVSYLAKVLSRNGVISIVALISPYKVSRDSARELIGNEEYVEVYVKASLAACEKRDPKGLYAKARKGEITNMTGIDDPYEVPVTPDITVDTEAGSPEDSARFVIEKLKEKGFFLGSSE